MARRRRTVAPKSDGDAPAAIQLENQEKARQEELRDWLRELSEQIREHRAAHGDLKTFAKTFANNAQKQTLELLMAMPGRTQPENPAEARKWFRDMSEEIKGHLAAYGDHETFVTAKYLRWLAAAADAYVADDYGSKKNLDQLLGLKNRVGHPKAQKPGKNFDDAYQIFILRSTKSATRKSKDGRFTPTPWKEIARILGMTPKRAQRIYEQEYLNVLAAFAKKLAARRRAPRNHPP